MDLERIELQRRLTEMMKKAPANTPPQECSNCGYVWGEDEDDKRTAQLMNWQGHEIQVVCGDCYRDLNDPYDGKGCMDVPWGFLF